MSTVGDMDFLRKILPDAGKPKPKSKASAKAAKKGAEAPAGMTHVPRAPTIGGFISHGAGGPKQKSAQR